MAHFVASAAQAALLVAVGRARPHEGSGKGATDLVALPPYPRSGDEGETKNALLLGVVHVMQNDRVTGEDRLDHSLVESHDEGRVDAAAGAIGVSFATSQAIAPGTKLA